MQYTWKLFKWNGGDISKRTELSQYLTVPIFLEKRLNERLSSGEVVLDGVPTLEYLMPFMPKTKLTVERWVDGRLEKYYDYVVDHDDVEHYAGCPEICCHRIYLIEPSVVAQGMHCDNFSLTYRLNDVTLDYKTVVPDGEKAVKSLKEIENNNKFERPEGEEKNNAWDYPHISNGTVYYENGYYYKWSDTSSIDGLLKRINGQQANTVKFTIPTLKCYANTESGSIFLFDCPVRCIVTRDTRINGVVQPKELVQVLNYLYTPGNIVQDRNDMYMYNSGGKAGLRYLSNEKVNHASIHYHLQIFRRTSLTGFPAIINTSIEETEKTVSFETTALTADEVNDKKEYVYSVTFTVSPYESGGLIQSYRKKCNITIHKPWDWWNNGVWGYSYSTTDENITSFQSDQARITLSFYATNLTTTIPTPFLLKGEPYNCYDLLRKAMLTCEDRLIDNSVTGLDEQTQDGIKYPIEPSEEWKAKLKQTKMYESVFEQKNLWEVITQLGYYLHVVPYLEFARDGEEKFILRQQDRKERWYEDDRI